MANPLLADKPGDIQLLKNSTILHGRAAFEDWDDPARRRHLLRLWINADSVFEDQGNIVKAVPTKDGVTSDADLLRWLSSVQLHFLSQRELYPTIEAIAADVRTFVVPALLRQDR